MSWCLSSGLSRESAGRTNDELLIYEILGAPTDVQGAGALKEISPHQFEWWAGVSRPSWPWAGVTGGTPVLRAARQGPQKGRGHPSVDRLHQLFRRQKQASSADLGVDVCGFFFGKSQTCKLVVGAGRGSVRVSAGRWERTSGPWGRCTRRACSAEFALFELCGTWFQGLRSLETPCTENWAGALHAKALRGILPVGGEMKTEILG